MKNLDDDEVFRIDVHVVAYFSVTAVCNPNPCLNGGACHADIMSYNRSNSKQYRCDCQEGYFGDRCEQDSK